MWNRKPPRDVPSRSVGDEPGLLPQGDPEFADPPLLAAARIKSRMFLEYVQEMVEESGYGGDVPALPIMQDYNGLRALIVEVAPKLLPALPPEILIPQSVSASGVEDADTKLITYVELLFFCQQIARFLK